MAGKKFDAEAMEPGEKPKRKLQVRAGGMERRFKEIDKMLRRGATDAIICAELGITQRTVAVHREKAVERYKAAVADDRMTLVTARLEWYAEVRWEAWKAWERSKEETLKVATEEAPLREPKVKGPAPQIKKLTVKAAMVLLKQVTTRERRLPAAQYLSIVESTIDAECRLLGLDAPRQLLLGDGRALQQIDWDAPGPEDAVKAKVRGILEAPEALEAPRLSPRKPHARGPAK